MNALGKMFKCQTICSKYFKSEEIFCSISTSNLKKYFALQVLQIWRNIWRSALFSKDLTEEDKKPTTSELKIPSTNGSNLACETCCESCLEFLWGHYTWKCLRQMWCDQAKWVGTS